MQDIGAIVRTVYTMFSRSSVKKQGLQAIAQASCHNLISFKAIHDVRWLSRHFAIQALVRNYDVLLDYCKEQGTRDPVAVFCVAKLESMQINDELSVLDDILRKLSDLSRAFQKSDITSMEAQAVARAQYLGEQKHWIATVQNLNNKSALIMDKVVPVVRFVEKLCTHLKSLLPEDKLCNWCTFDYSCIKQANFNFGLNELQQFFKQFSYFFHCYGPGHESDTLNAYNDFKFLAKETFKVGGNVGLSNLAGICFRREKFSTVLCLLQMCSSFQSSSADCERGFSIMNRIKNKSRCKLEPYLLVQLMMVKSVFTTTSETTVDDSDDGSVTYYDSAINLDKVCKHILVIFRLSFTSKPHFVCNYLN